MDVALKEPLAITWKDELLQLISKQSLRVPIPIILGALVIALMASDAIAPIYWISWIFLEIIAVTIRRFSFPLLAQSAKLTVDHRLWIMVLITLFNSVAHGLSLFFFPSLTEIERAVHSLILLLACVGSVVTTNGYRPMLIAYLSPILLPLIVLWAVSPQIENAGWAERAMSVLLALFSLVLFSHARDIFRLFRESFDIRSQQVELNSQLEEALNVAESANRAKTSFLASASHDLRQPIHAASLFSAALKRRPLDDQTKEIANQLDHSIETMVLQLDTLLDISKLDAGVFKVTETDINICSLVQRIHRDLLELSREKSLGFDVICKEQIVIRTDTQLLERVLRNLIGNAIKYTDTGNITITVGQVNGECKVSIADT
ncbi:MAG: HAMP domain-containing sensor histidine kinase, partial [Gammaproteobacteria bacterium]